ncbi:MAG: tRNA (N6-isopentenyl adenosine(37)-C2)-methylthiotransferase MiaB [Candidatus Pacebacteria bacterium]|nr:tRNA (N6-isopentenyl adenosine(37)-C2)-methylthiotransferase MiaB [Candidatus Paceibacterota bacterium]
MKKYHIVTFGCQMNISDSERISTIFESMGFIECPSIDEADIIIMNMCSVRQSAVDRILGQAVRLSELKKTNKRLKLILTGCFLESDKFKFNRIFDYVLKKEDLEIWPQILTDLDIRKKKMDYLKIDPKRSSSFQASVPISNGCDNFCTYCAVPFTRGRLVSRSHKSIIKEIRDLAKKGYKEIWLLGENVNSYHSPDDINFDFASLIRAIDEIDGDFWLRFTSPHPKDFSDSLIEALAESPKFAPYINLPAQAGNNEILRKMNRPYTSEQYLKLIKKIKKAFSSKRSGLEREIAISTDIIVGFPTESEEQFLDTLELFKKAEFDMAFIAQYSPRPESHCYKNMADDVKKTDKRSRHKILTESLKEIGEKKNKIFQDQTIPVLVFEKYKSYYLGRNRQNKSVKIFSKQEDLVGKIIDVTISKTLPLSLEGNHIYH